MLPLELATSNPSSTLGLDRMRKRAFNIEGDSKPSPQGFFPMNSGIVNIRPTN